MGRLGNPILELSTAVGLGAAALGYIGTLSNDDQGRFFAYIEDNSGGRGELLRAVPMEKVIMCAQLACAGLSSALATGESCTATCGTCGAGCTQSGAHSRHTYSCGHQDHD